jgi:hypothetical protein
LEPPREWWRAHNRAVRALIAVAVWSAVVAASATAGRGAGGNIASCRWRVLLDTPGPELSAVAPITDNDVWAVGDDGAHAAIMHWDGRNWRKAVSSMFAFDIDAVSARDIWAVGSSAPAGLQTRPRAEHWDGARWRPVPVPGEPGSYLRAVAALSPSDGWAVGAKERGPLFEHWNGRAWKPAAGGPRDGLLHGIDALTSGAVWAVGTQGMTSSTQSEDPLIERLQGGRWAPPASPHLDSVDENLLAVDAVSPSVVWAVGSVDVLGGRAPLVEVWDGRAWRVESISGLPSARAALTAVTAFGPADVWAGGYRGFGVAERALLAHWDGRHWTQVPGRSGGLNDLAALSARDIWAVGGFVAASGKSRSLVERYSCGG